MSKKILILFSLVILLFGGLFVACDGDDTDGNGDVNGDGNGDVEEPIVLTYSSPFMEGIIHSEAHSRFLDKITEETDGRVQFDKYFAGTLAGEDTAYYEIADGVCDVGYYSIGYLNYGIPINNALLPMWARNSDVIISLDIFKELCAEFPEIAAESSEVKILGEINVTAGQWISGPAHPMYSIDDMDGLQVAASDRYEPIVSRYGGVLCVMASTDYSVSLQKGTIDAFIGQYDMIAAYALGDVVDSVTWLNIANAPDFCLGMNWDTWNSLPADIQQVFEDNYDYLGYGTAYDVFWDEMIVMTDAIRDEYGIEMIYLPEEDLEKIYEVYDELADEAAAELDAEGLPGTEIWERIQELQVEYGVR